MKERVKVDITKDAYKQIQHVNFSDVVVKLKSLKCELNLDDKTEKDHCAILDIELPQEEHQMNIDKVETQTEHQEETSAFGGEVDWKNGDECVVINDNDRYCVYDEHKKHLGSVGIIRSLFKIKNGTEMAAVQAENGDCICWRVVMLTKPETKQQSEDRERLEAAYDLYVAAQKSVGSVKIVTYELFTLAESINLTYWLAIVDKTNYRKGVK